MITKTPKRIAKPSDTAKPRGYHAQMVKAIAASDAKMTAAQLIATGKPVEASAMGLTFAFRVETGESTYGTRMPRIELVRGGWGTDDRKVSAILHVIAAHVELATERQNRWSVRVDDTLVAIDVIDDTDAEVAAAERTLVRAATALAGC